MNYQPTIGLEIHIELTSKSKMFCSCPNDSNEKYPNFNICPICLGHPGTLPTINQEAVKKVIKTGLALNCQISEYSKFDRKNYFYPDLPKGYQISQLYQPLCRNGFLEIDGKKIGIREIHLEEDTASLIHPPHADYSLVNFNRAGIPLMELATEPHINSARQARRFAQELHLIIHYLNISDADMEKGQMRVEANVSLSKEKRILGTKVEIKNLNSFRALERAIEHEIKRQAEILDSGKKIIQETRGWDDLKEMTFPQREKEFAQDYRYFPEPDLPPLHLNSEIINKIRSEIPELPQQKRKRFKKEYQLDEKSIEIFVYNKDWGEYFEKTMLQIKHKVQEIDKEKKFAKGEFLKLAKLCSNYIISDLRGLLKKTSLKNANFLITPENFAKFIVLIYRGQISSKIAKLILGEMFSVGTDPFYIIEKRGLMQISQETQIKKIIKEVIRNNPKTIEDYKKGKEKAIQYLIGKTMEKTQGKANPQIVIRILKQLLTRTD